MSKIRKGSKVRYVGHHAQLREAWGKSNYTVIKLIGNSAIGSFPICYNNGEVCTAEYSIPIKDLEIVK